MLYFRSVTVTRDFYFEVAQNCNVFLLFAKKKQVAYFFSVFFFVFFSVMFTTLVRTDSCRSRPFDIRRESEREEDVGACSDVRASSFDWKDGGQTQRLAAFASDHCISNRSSAR